MRKNKEEFMKNLEKDLEEELEKDLEEELEKGLKDAEEEPKAFLKYSIKKFKESRAFIFLLVITAALVISPALLRIPKFSDLLADFLFPLKTQEFKSAYVEAISALMGTFLAIYGALWTQRRIDSKADVKKKRAALVVVYYDLRFAYNDLKKMFYKEGKLNISCESGSYRENVIANLAVQGAENLFIDNEWIRNVASLSNVFNTSEIQMIFKMYGEISTIKMILESYLGNQDKKDNPDNKDNLSVDDNKEIERISSILKIIFTEESDSDNNKKIVLRRGYREMIYRIYTKMEDSYTKPWKIFNDEDVV